MTASPATNDQISGLGDARQRAGGRGASARWYAARRSRARPRPPPAGRPPATSGAMAAGRACRHQRCPCSPVGPGGGHRVGTASSQRSRRGAAGHGDAEEHRQSRQRIGEEHAGFTTSVNGTGGEANSTPQREVQTKPFSAATVCCGSLPPGGEKAAEDERRRDGDVEDREQGAARRTAGRAGGAGEGAILGRRRPRCARAPGCATRSRAHPGSGAAHPRSG